MKCGEILVAPEKSMLWRRSQRYLQYGGSEATWRRHMGAGLWRSMTVMDRDKMGKYTVCVQRKANSSNLKVRIDILGELSWEQRIKNLGLQNDTEASGRVCRALNPGLHGSHRLTHVILRMAHWRRSFVDKKQKHSNVSSFLQHLITEEVWSLLLTTTLYCLLLI